jgi:putative transposase
MRALGLQGQRPARPPRTTQSPHASPRAPHRVQGVTIVRPTQVWVGDMTSVRLPRECVSLAVLLDVSTRGIRGWHLRRPLDQTLTVTAWRRALVQHRPEIHHADPGVQDAATASRRMWQNVGAQLRMAAVGETTEHG